MMAEKTPDSWFFNGVRIGRCSLCWQELLLTDDDCWHPFSVNSACPPEPVNMSERIKLYETGHRTLRPGSGYWEPVPEGAFKITGTDFRKGEKFYLGQIVTADEARQAGLDPLVRDNGSGRRVHGQGFSGYEMKPPMFDQEEK